jgi:hypothetical protein
MTQIGEGVAVVVLTATPANPCSCCGKDPCTSPPDQVPTVVPIGKPVDLGCGGSTWKVWFNLPKKTCKGGWVVQEVKFTIDRRKKDGSVLLQQTFHFWEAWEVKPCKDKTVWQDQKLDTNDDEYRDSSVPNSKGSHVTVGTVKFYEGPLPGDFKQNNPKTLAGILHSTTTKPGFWDGSGAAHNVTSTWDCTDGKNNPTKIVTVPTVP